MESRWHNFDPGEDADSREKLIAKARHRYVEVGSELAAVFVERFEKAKQPIKGVLRQVAGIGTGLFDLEPPKVRIEIRGRGKCVSRPVSASYGFEDATGEIRLKLSEDNAKKIEPDTVTVMLIEEITQKTVSVVLLDAASGVELATLDKIEVVISI